MYLVNIVFGVDYAPNRKGDVLFAESHADEKEGSRSAPGNDFLLALVCYNTS